MKIALFSIVIAMATAVVAHPVHSRPLLADTEHALARRGVPGGSVSGLHAATNPLTRRDVGEDWGAKVCELLKMKEFVQFKEDAKKIWKQIEGELEGNEDIKDLKDVLEAFLGSAKETLDEIGKKTIADVVKELNKGGNNLGTKVEDVIKTASEELEAALVTFALKVAECLEKDT
ncbi:hypothetical protein BGZ68_000709 [Mortierella alpina]|nr:hypothetical protein BGZ68_000709 [Mortierella alpina]